MRVFVTGASGHIASAVIPELLSHGHAVVGLARSESSTDAVSALGAEVRRGDLDDLDGLREAASQADGVIHLAYKHDAMRAWDLDTAVNSDMAAARVLGEALAQTGKPLVATGGTFTLAMGGIVGRTATEEDRPSGGPRTDAAYAAELRDRGVRSSVIRVAPMVHSELDHHGFTPALIGFARERGAAAYIDAGDNRWPAVHTRDLAVLYRLALERAPAGSVLHGVDDEGIPFREIAETIAARLGVGARSVTAEQAPEALGFLASFAGTDNPTSSAITRSRLGWETTHPGWVQDLQDDHYFAGVTTGEQS